MIKTLLTVLAQRVNLPNSSAKASAIGSAIAGATVAGMATGGLDTLEGQISACVSSIISLVLFLYSKKGDL